MTADEPRWEELALEAGRVFTPTSPIDERSLFAGREEQVRLIVDVVNQKGQHGILYGERGVGKTSLANVLSSFLGNRGNLVAPRVNCDGRDTFESVWLKVFDHIQLSRPVGAIGFGQAEAMQAVPGSELLVSGVSPDSVRRALTLLSRSVVPILIIDEFDRLPDQTRCAFADTVKTLSDHAVGATVVLVGVADSVEQLIQEHESVERALVQIRMPRMSSEEIRQILVTGTARLGVRIDEPALTRIARLAQGLPHYAHLLGLHSVRVAVDSRASEISGAVVDQAIERSVQGAQQSIRSRYEYSIRSARKDSLFSDVLLACALARTSELGYFAAQDVRSPLRRITGKQYDIPSYAPHLNEFCDAKRGPILEKSGSRKRYRYRFLNPLLQPYVIMQGVRAGRVPGDLLA